MKRKMLSLALLFGILLLAVFVMPVGATTFELAGDSHWHYDLNVGPYGSWYIHRDEVQGRGEYGTFTVHYDDITFFICDEANFNKYKNGDSYVRYSVLDDVVDGNYKFRFPRADDWYRVFCNKDSVFSKDITFDVYQDRTPPTITLNLDTGATYSGIKEIRATASDASFSVWKLSLQYYRSGWKTAKTEYNTESISYNWDTKDWNNGDVRWRVVAEDNVNNEAIKEAMVTVYNHVAPSTTTTGGTTTTTGGATRSPPNNLGLFLIITVFLIIGIGIAYAVKRRGKEDLTEVPEQVTSRDAKVLVVCRFCGSKTEQGIMKCQNCGADL